MSAIIQEVESSSLEDDSPILGIDLGTTYSCVAVYDEKIKEVVVLANSEGSRTTPSYIGFTENGQRLIGMSAKQQAASNAKCTIYDVKRILGRTIDDPVLEDEKRRLSYNVILDTVKRRPMIEIAWQGETKRYAPEELSAMVLSEMRTIALAYFGEEENSEKLKRAVITVPAHFNDQQRQATKDAGKIAGLNVVRIINEPTAAALAYGLHDAQARRPCVLIFDLGGGTFDVSVLSMEDGVFAVKATGGDTHLGGQDFDQALAEFILARYASITLKNRKNCPKDLKKQRDEERKIANEIKKRDNIFRRLILAAENSKKNLSIAENTQIRIPLWDDKDDLVVDIQRQDFEECCNELFERCISTVRQVINDAKFSLDDVTECVLVGGSTRVPALQQKLRSLFNNRLELCKHVHPDEAVAYGAAVQGSILRAGGTGGAQDLAPAICGDLVLLDVTPLSLGIELEGGQMSTLVKRGTPIPCAKTREYTTVDDFQTSIDVVVYEGERPVVSGNTKLGEFLINGIERARKGEPKIEVTFTLDADGILKVSAKDRVTGASASTQIKADRGRLSDEDIESMIKEAERLRQQDLDYASRTTFRNALEQGVLLAKQKNSSPALEDMLDWLDLDATDASMADLQIRADELKTDYGISVHHDGTIA
eukprot:CAMPEP_0197286146 /NCGR_PEP_ID=MMETSP0890-20130614/1630_1 /TAXON_ID=44058 ORGANISM="Aureoumbra lagunensis, Strain CCMP1510" /NCGR_SAMPLE_ID=MMETSP0890 /ASSEMBLY_ACC=CAM_ASM_000533 /LENGTH=652 /DNA_ID=CAMNT_0042754323 /DNA_START=42 /DNA_END=2000 /DNA_ORIENTATION=-